MLVVARDSRAKTEDRRQIGDEIAASKPFADLDPLGQGVFTAMFLCGWCIRRFESQGAFVLSGETAVAYFKFHAPQGFWPLLNDG